MPEIGGKVKYLLPFVLAVSLHAQAIDRRVTQENVKQTICVPGYTKTVRPPVAYTSRIKRQQIYARHMYMRPQDLELDHVIPLSLGGAPRDPRNLNAQPWPEAHQKDREENRLHRLVCRGAITLKEAQDEIVRWKPKQ